MTVNNPLSSHSKLLYVRIDLDSHIQLLPLVAYDTYHNVQTSNCRQLVLGDKHRKHMLNNASLIIDTSGEGHDRYGNVEKRRRDCRMLATL